nr:serine/threonine protein kinase [Deltaproteobacteria bacterium]
MERAPYCETVSTSPVEALSPSDSGDNGDREYILAKVRATLASPENTDVAAGQHIGRFLVINKVGHGGMGAVYAAYDEQLDRKVAVKVMRVEGLPTEDDRQRFVREAQALARVSHPNVVTIHEVGKANGALFLATEFLQGQHLGEWQRTNPGWRAIVGAYVQAGRGLAAVHEEGLIHRDFKPSNAMRTTTGIVKVLDFGLARYTDATSAAETQTAGDSTPSATSSLTQTGVVIGTPAYMSPEQHEGLKVDARSDQYSFCVALWEALAGARPFTETTLGQMSQAKSGGPPPWPSGGVPLPRRLADVLRRGLSPSPDDRWPSLDALLEHLAWDPDKRRNRGAT